ncbi:MAG: lipocalin-like domain-containing protein [Pseudomonadota bacterium]|nr:lipocalin-like domain-containing protein [Pseudomonadota bacterium]
MKDQIVGTWLLERFLIESSENGLRDWGTNAQGLLIYTSSGHMSVSINRDVEKKSAVEAQNYFDSILFYSGTFAVDATTVKHQVTQASNPTRIGKEQIRYAKLENNILTLTSPDESFGRAILTWKKIA